MATKILFAITILAYAIIVSQAFMYILSLRSVQANLDARAYIQLRKLTDTSMRRTFKYVIYVALLANLMLVVATARTPDSLHFVSSTIALVALIAEVLLALKGNIPLNDVINGWSGDNFPADWASVREKWFVVFQYRQIVTITGFVALLIGVVFGN